MDVGVWEPLPWQKSFSLALFVLPVNASEVIGEENQNKRFCSDLCEKGNSSSEQIQFWTAERLSTKAFKQLRQIWTLRNDSYTIIWIFLEEEFFFKTPEGSRGTKRFLRVSVFSTFSYHFSLIPILMLLFWYHKDLKQHISSSNWINEWNIFGEIWNLQGCRAHRRVPNPFLPPKAWTFLAESFILKRISWLK